MKALDFEYNNLRLSDFGFQICKFDSEDIETISNGSEITFNTVSTLNGMKHELTSSQYDDCITFTLQICKNICDGGVIDVSFEESRNIMRWLNRKNFHKFKLIDNDFAGVYFETSFKVSKIEISGRIVGFELEATTNRPFAVGEPVSILLKSLSKGSVKTVFSESDEEGSIYPDMEIEIKQDGDFEMKNLFNNRVMRIANCKNGEVITVSYPIIKSTIESHKIQNDFNWSFFRIENTFKNKKNEITFSLPCAVKITYSPIVKVTI